jgi:hypothetical protein
MTISQSIVMTGNLFLIYDATKTYVIWANPHYFHVFTSPGGSGSGREHVEGGCPYIYEFPNSPITEFVMGLGMATSATDSVAGGSFRRYPYHGAAALIIMNGVKYEQINDNQDTLKPRLIIPIGGLTGEAGAGVSFHDESVLVSEPMLSTGVVTPGKIVGQFYDSIYVHESYPSESQIDFDGRRFAALTNANIGSAHARGTLFLRIPSP